MSGLLFVIACFGFTSAVMSFSPRRYPNTAWPFIVFMFSSPTIELAWLYFCSQFASVLVLGAFGALHGPLGKVALMMLLVSWLIQAYHFRLAFKTPKILKTALESALGHNYFHEIPDDRRSTIRTSVSFENYNKPLGFDKSNIEVIRNIPYTDKPAVRQMLDIYKPKTVPEGGCPVLLQIHGGAWVVGSKEHQGLPLMHYLAERGWICVAINYRLSPSIGFPSHALDCKAALSWIRREGHNYGMNPDFVAVTGGSAGGHLASLLALTANSPDLQPENDDTDTSIQACIPLFGVYDMLSRHGQNEATVAFDEFLVQQVMHIDRSEQNKESWDLYSPLMHISEEAPPFLIMHGTLDKVVPVTESQLFQKQLSEISKNPVAYGELEGADHAFELFNSPRTAFAVNSMHEFLEWCYAEHQDKHQGVSH